MSRAIIFEDPSEDPDPTPVVAQPTHLRDMVIQTCPTTGILPTSDLAGEITRYNNFALRFERDRKDFLLQIQHIRSSITQTLNVRVVQVVSTLKGDPAFPADQIDLSTLHDAMDDLWKRVEVLKAQIVALEDGPAYSKLVRRYEALKEIYDDLIIRHHRFVENIDLHKRAAILL